MTYIWRGLVLPQLAVGFPVGFLVSMATGVSLNEGDVVIVRAGGSGQDPHEVAVVAEVLQQAGHPPKDTQKHVVSVLSRVVSACLVRVRGSVKYINEIDR